MNYMGQRSKELGKLIKELGEKIPRIDTYPTKLPEGKLRIDRKNKSHQYYLVTEKGDTIGHYIRKEDRAIVPRIALRDYYKRTLREAIREKKAIDGYMRGMNGTPPEKVYDKMSDMRKELISPIILSNEEYAKRWQEETYEQNPYRPENKIYETKRGEMVRTKSEAMLADMYYELGIPYRYECPLVLHDGQIRYPDFTLLKVSERKLIYHEHMGMLEDPEYRKKNLTKISEYTQSGISFLDNLYLTLETEYEPLNINSIRRTVSALCR